MTAPDPPLVRSAQASDATAIARVSARAFEATYRGIVPDPALDEWISHAPTTWRDALERSEPDTPTRVWVAERSGLVIGYAVASPGKDWWRPPPDGAGEITSLYLDPEVIGTGVGRLLYERAVADLAGRGFDPLVVWAFRENARALAFYERMGLAIDVADHDWVLADIPCPIVRFRGTLSPKAG